MTDDADRLPHMPAPVGAEAIEIGEIIAGPGLAGSGVDQPLGVISACMVVGTVALMILGVQPVLLGALTQAHRVTDAELGPLATIEVLALALGSAIGPALLRTGAMRLKTGILSLLLAGANLAIYGVHSVLMLDVLRGAAGLIEGLMMGATIVITIQNREPDRLNAIFLALSALPQALMAYLLPVWIVPQYGANGGFVVLAVLSVISAGSCLFLVDSVPAPAPDTTGTPVWTAPIFLALAAVAFQNAAIGGAWDYMQLLADQHHFPPEMAGIAVSGGLIFQVAGAFAVAAWGGRFSFRGALIVGTLCQTGVIGCLAVAGTPMFYVIPALTFGLFWLAMSPFQVRLLIDLDPTRSAALVLMAVSLVGLSVGPTISALGVHGEDVTGAFWIAAGLMAAAFLLYGLIAFRAGSKGSAAVHAA